MCKSLAESEEQVKHQKHGLGYSAKQWTVKTRDQQLKKKNFNLLELLCIKK